MKNLYVQMRDYDILLDLDKAIDIQRFNNRIVIHFDNPEPFTVFDNQDEFDILNDYFKMLAKDRLKLSDLSESKPWTRENHNESI